MLFVEEFIVYLKCIKKWDNFYSDEFFADLPSLKSSTTYRVMVEARNKAGGVEGFWFNCTTPTCKNDLKEFFHCAHVFVLCLFFSFLSSGSLISSFRCLVLSAHFIGESTLYMNIIAEKKLSVYWCISLPLSPLLLSPLLPLQYIFSNYKSSLRKDGKLSQKSSWYSLRVSFEFLWFAANCA